MKEEVLSVIFNSFNEMKNSHAFLMETDDVEECLKEILNLIKKINSDKISSEKIIENDNYSDIKIIRPNGREIKTDQVREIINDFQTFPFILRHKYYIIVSSEFMNASSANILLKFLEEPENMVIGFFITANKRKMINTIVSRCQTYRLLFNKSLEENKEVVDDFLNSMNEKQIYRRILFLNNWISKDRIENIEKLSLIKNHLVTEIKNLIEIKKTVSKINLLDECIDKLRKNANQDLVILELARKW